MKKEKGRETGTAAGRRDLVPEITAEIGIRLTLDPEGVIYLEIERRSGGERVGEVVDFPVDRFEIVDFPVEPEEIEKFRREHTESFGLIRAATDLEAVFDRNFPSLIAELFGALYWRTERVDPTGPLDEKTKGVTKEKLKSKMKRLRTIFSEIMIPSRYKQTDPETVMEHKGTIETVTTYELVRGGPPQQSTEEIQKEKKEFEPVFWDACKIVEAEGLKFTKTHVAEKILKKEPDWKPVKRRKQSKKRNGSKYPIRDLNESNFAYCEDELLERETEDSGLDKWLGNKLKKYGIKWPKANVKRLKRE